MEEDVIGVFKNEDLQNLFNSLVEKVITLENISLIDFLGVQNKNIKEVAQAFPKSKIVSRGNEIRIQGSTPEIIKISDILTSLINHYHKFGKVTPLLFPKFMVLLSKYGGICEV